MTVTSLGDSAVLLELSRVVDEVTTIAVRSVAESLRRDPPAGVIDVVPAYSSIAVFYDPCRAGPYDELCARLVSKAETVMALATSNAWRPLVELPVCYDLELGPDLGDVASHAKMTVAEVVTLHSQAEYVVFAIGFVPGFAYLGGLPAQLAVPRRATPRPRVPAGSLGIGGDQTGIYPLETPGGWNLIGRTPLRLFSIDATPPSLLQAGDRVKFRPISKPEFESWK